ncbi:GFA family protein [bacterium]|nr:GFA family protein [bacterium]
MQNKTLTLKGSCHCKKVSWHHQAMPEDITACNCTVCSRYGVLWAYGYLNDTIKIQGKTQSYQRGDKVLSFHFCSTCGCVAYWLSNQANALGKYRIAVNIRLIDNPKQIEHLSIRHFEGLHSFKDLPMDQCTVKDLWF